MNSLRHIHLVAALVATLGVTSLQGALVLPTTNLECDGCNASQFGVLQLPAVNNVSGLKFFTTSPVAIEPDEEGDEFLFFELTTFGPVTDVPPASSLLIPFSYNFTLSTTGNLTVGEWLLTVFIVFAEDFEEEEGAGMLGFTGFSGTGTGSFADFGFISFEHVGAPNGFANAFGGVLLSFEVEVSGEGTLLLDSPQSFNIGATSTDVPEPSTLASSGLAAGLLLLAARLRRSRS